MEAWPTKRHPSRHDTQDDQRQPEMDILQDFKQALKSKEEGCDFPDFFHSAPPALKASLCETCVEVCVLCFLCKSQFTSS